ncbi:MAG: tol-pal system YbgF family protein [Polyangiales bacterium]
MARTLAATFVCLTLLGTFAPRTYAQPVSDESSVSEEQEQAQEAETEARARFEAGRALVQVGSYEAARLEFRRGYVLSQRPLFLFNMAECARRLGNPDVARREYAEYVRQDEDGAFVAMAETRLTELGPGDRSTPDFVLELAEAPEEPELSTTEVTPPAVPEVTLSPEVVANGADLSAPDEATDERPWFRDWPFWTTVGGLVLAGVITGVILGTRDSSCGSGCQELDWRMQ